MTHRSEQEARLVYDVPEAGAKLGLSRAASYAAAARGDLPVMRIGKLLKVPIAAFDKMLERAGCRTSPKATS